MASTLSQATGITPEALEALSWQARNALAAKQLDQADQYANQTLEQAAALLKTRPLDAEPRLPIALGAAIEVKAQVMNQRGERGEALAFLRKELAQYKAASIAARIQKNINLIDLVGKPAPALDEHVYVGPKPLPLAALKGKPVLLFFWAHWCGDCKLQRRELSQIKSRYASKGLVLIGPTQRYGYVARGEEAGPDQELKYIEEVRRKYYADLSDMAAPVSESTFKAYGASTTPTIVIIDRHGIVRLFHPGKMSLEELEAAVHSVV
ncbi:MAG: TlpA family protein disulfide reductase [Acidobacteriota bacterium]|nr:TlpA family protein disulfide reductase [Acidobacteriota bacterium]